MLHWVENGWMEFSGSTEGQLDRSPKFALPMLREIPSTAMAGAPGWQPA
jgi:hypothetical protein